MSKVKVFSTFTGIGSPEMALRNIGCDYEVVGISEVDRHAIIAYDAIHNLSSLVKVEASDYMVEEMREANIAYNFSTGKDEMPRGKKDILALYEAHKRSLNYGDIRLINASELPSFDLFTYSFPCKNISVAGEQSGLSKDSGTQSSLLWECERIIKEKKPRYLLMENVKNLVGNSHIDQFKEWIAVLSDLGYSSKYKVLNASDFGIPQNRERVMMVSVLGGDCPDLPIGKKTSNSVSMIAEPHDSVCKGLIYKEGMIVFKSDIKVLHSQLNHVGNIDGKTHSNKRVYCSMGYSPTLNSMNGGNRQPKIMFSDCSRRLSPIECWRLMGFYDSDFRGVEKLLPKSKLYERAGRGIAIPMLEEIFKNMGFGNV